MSRPIEVRDGGGSGLITLSSYASVFNTPYTINSRVRYDETVAPGAFRASLASNPDVVFRLEHNGPPLARTSAGNLRLTEDAVGLRYEAHLDPEDPDVQSLVPKIRNGNYTESSFAFRTVQDEWSSDRSQRTLREADIDRGDVSIVTYGASSATGRYVQMRAHLSPQERRAITDAISRQGLGGAAPLLWRGWQNQHGASCSDCGGSGECSSCNGAGWIPNDDGDDDGGEQNAARRRSRIVVPPSRIPEFEAQLRVHRERVKR